MELTPRHAQEQRPRRKLRPYVLRIPLVAITTGLGILVFFREYQVRDAEAGIASWLLNATLAEHAKGIIFPGGPGMVYQIGGNGYSLVITSECSVALLLGPLLFMAAAFFLAPRLKPLRVVLAVSVSGCLLVMLNQVRFIMLAFARMIFGMEGFEWAHSLVGSFLMLFGLAGCLWICFAVVVAKRKGERAASARRGNL